MLIQITKASDYKYREEREISSLEDLRKIAHEFRDPTEDYDTSLVLYYFDDKPFQMIVQIYDDYIE